MNYRHPRIKNLGAILEIPAKQHPSKLGNYSSIIGLFWVISFQLSDSLYCKQNAWSTAMQKLWFPNILSPIYNMFWYFVLMPVQIILFKDNVSCLHLFTFCHLSGVALDMPCHCQCPYSVDADKNKIYRIVASRSTCYYSENQIFCFLKSQILTLCIFLLGIEFFYLWR